MHARLRLAAAGLAALLLFTPVRVDADSVATARELYAAADYARALETIEALRSAAPAGAERQALDLYRVLCLVALGRKADAEQAIEAMIAEDPRYRPAHEDVPPRLRAAFTEARQRLLPSIVQARYADAKAALDRGQHAAAVAGFAAVLAALDDPEMAAAAARPPLSDLRLLAAGFHDLAVKASTPPPLAAARVVASVAAPVLVADRVYSVEDAAVTPPVAVEQRVPPYQMRPGGRTTGVLEIVVDETGEVESATMLEPLDPQFDRQLQSAARSWRYQPARLHGQPVKYRKRIAIHVGSGG